MWRIWRTSLSIRRFWGKRGKMEAKKGERWRRETSFLFSPSPLPHGKAWYSGYWRTRQCRVFIFGHHTEQQQVHKIKSKFYQMLWRWCCPDRKNSYIFGELGFRKSSPTVSLFTRFWYLPCKKSYLQSLSSFEKIKASCMLDLPYAEKLKHQWQLFIWYVSGFRLRTQGTKCKLVSQISIRSF